MPKALNTAGPILALLLSTLPATAAEWKVIRAAGGAWIGGTQQRQLIARGMFLENGATITTNANGRVMLSSGRDTMTVGPNSIVTVPTDSPMQTVVQVQGRSDLDIERLTEPHFKVVTPFLAAVVKGTQFSIAVSQGGANVAVDQGVVEVTDPVSGDSIDVSPGQVAATSGAGIAVTEASTGTVIATAGGPGESVERGGSIFSGGGPGLQTLRDDPSGPGGPGRGGPGEGRGNPGHGGPGRGDPGGPGHGGPGHGGPGGPGHGGPSHGGPGGPGHSGPGEPGGGPEGHGPGGGHGPGSPGGGPEGHGPGGGPGPGGPGGGPEGHGPGGPGGGPEGHGPGGPGGGPEGGPGHGGHGRP